MTPLLSIDGLIYWYKGEANEYPEKQEYSSIFEADERLFLRDCVLCEDQDRAKELIALEETNKTPYQIQDRTLYFVDVEFEEVEQYRTALFGGIEWSHYDPKLNGPKDSEDFDYRAVARIKKREYEIGGGSDMETNELPEYVKLKIHEAVAKVYKATEIRFPLRTMGQIHAEQVEAIAEIYRLGLQSSSLIQVKVVNRPLMLKG